VPEAYGNLHDIAEISRQLNGDEGIGPSENPSIIIWSLKGKSGRPLRKRRWKLGYGGAGQAAKKRKKQMRQAASSKRTMKRVIGFARTLIPTILAPRYGHESA